MRVLLHALFTFHYILLSFSALHRVKFFLFVVFSSLKLILFWFINLNCKQSFSSLSTYLISILIKNYRYLMRKIFVYIKFIDIYTENAEIILNLITITSRWRRHLCSNISGRHCVLMIVLHMRIWLHWHICRNWIIVWHHCKIAHVRIVCRYLMKLWRWITVFGIWTQWHHVWILFCLHSSILKPNFNLSFG